MSVKPEAPSHLMQGFPPSPDQRVTAENLVFPPWNRWAYQHIRELLPTREVSRGAAPVSPIEEAPIDLSAMTFVSRTGDRTTLDQMLDLTAADALVILHDGRLVYETYRNGMHARRCHLMWSVTKSLVGTLAEQLAVDGVLDTAALVTDFIPELAGSAWGDATVRHALDMTTGVRFDEIYDDPNSHIGLYSAASGWTRAPEGYDGPRHLYELLPIFEKAGAHGDTFHYVTPNTDVVGWLIARACNRPFSQVLCERIWSRLGMQEDAYIVVDSVGSELAGGGFNATARDLARFGQLILNDGVHNGEQLIDSGVIAAIREGGDRDTFAKGAEGSAESPTHGWSYRSFWWHSHNRHRAFTGIGIHGQWLWIDPAARMVAVLQSSHPDAVNEDVDDVVVRGFEAIGSRLMDTMS